MMDHIVVSPPLLAIICGISSIIWVSSMFEISHRMEWRDGWGDVE